MSRIARDPNNWVGDLNNIGLSAVEIANAKAKTGYTETQKRYGPLGAAGSSGVVKRGGKDHDAVFELTGDEIVTENGAPSVKAFPIEIPANAKFTELTTLVHSVFKGVAPKLGYYERLADGSFKAVQLAAPVVPVLTAVGVTNKPVTAPLKSGAWGGQLALELTGVLAEPASMSGGQAEIVVSYIAL